MHYFETGAFGSRQPAWHGLGTVLEGEMTWEEAYIEAGLDWQVYRSPLITLDRNKKAERIDTHVCLRRSTDDKILGVVGQDYSILQNHEAFEFMDNLLEEGVRYDAAGSLKEGRVIFLLAHMPEALKIAGDDVKTYVTLINGHDGRMKLQACCTETRVVCWNTVNIALNDARGGNRLWTRRHTSGLHNSFESAKEFLKFTERRKKAVLNAAESLLKIKLNRPAQEAIIDELVPYDSESKRSTTIGQKKQNALWMALNAPDLENFRDTGWGMLNAIADFSCHYDSRTTDAYKENRFLEIATQSSFLEKGKELILSYS